MYLADGSIAQFRACTHPSDPNKFTTVPEGLYEAKIGIHKGTRSVYTALRVGDVGTTNFDNNKINLKMPNPSNPATNYATGINIHKAGGGNLTGYDRNYNPMSKGCFLISKNDWEQFIGYFMNDAQSGNTVSITLSRTMVMPQYRSRRTILYRPNIDYKLPISIPISGLSLPF